MMDATRFPEERLALETAATAVTVNAVCPGFTDTELVAESLDRIVAKTGRSREAALAELDRHNPQKRLIEPREVADAVLWLCGDGARSVTGQAAAVEIPGDALILPNASDATHKLILHLRPAADRPAPDARRPLRQRMRPAR